MTKLTNAIKETIDELIISGIGPSKIAKQLKINSNTLKSYLSKKRNLANLPPKIIIKRDYFQGRVGGIVKRYVRNNPISTSLQILAACDLTCSRQWLEQFLNKNGLKRTKAKRYILLNEVNRIKSLSFCKDLLTWDDARLERILFTDETMVKSYPNGEFVFYRALKFLKNKVSPNVQQGGSGQMLWGCMSKWAYGPLEAIEGHITGDSYLNLLINVVKREMDASSGLGRELIFQQDNAKPHKTQAVMNYLKNWGYEILDWPPQSPDLSPIETIWNVMKMRMKAMTPRPRTKASMRDAMMDIWDKLEDDLRVKLMNSFKKRLQACVANNGGLIFINKL